MTLRFAWTRRVLGADRAPAGDSIWPVLGVLVGLLAGASTLELTARDSNAEPLVVRVGGSNTGETLGEDAEGGEDDTAVLSEAPALSDEHVRARALALRGEAEKAVDLFSKVVKSSPGSAAVHAEYGFWLLRAKRQAEARAELDLAAQLAPNDPRTAFKRGLVLADLGDRSGAAGEYRRALSLLATFDRARVALGNLLVRQKQYSEAAAVLEPATKRGSNQDRARALVAYGRAVLKLGRFEPAEKAFNAAVERAPAHAEMRLKIGRAWLRSPRAADASRAVAMLTLARELAPESPAIHGFLAQALEQSGDAVSAEHEYEDALRLDPQYTFVRKRLLHRALAREDVKRARYHADRLVADEPERPEHHLLVGLVATRMGALDEARAQYQEAIDKLADGYPEAWLNLGLLEKGAGDLATAASAFRHAIQLRPKYAAAHNSLGLVLEDLEDLEGAEQSLRAAIAAEPGSASARVNLGSFLSRRKRYGEAIRELEGALRLRPDYPAAELNLGVAFLRKGESKRAVEICRSLVRRLPRHVGAWYDLGLALRQSGDPDGASKAFRTVLELDPEHVTAVKRLAELERQASRFAEAITLYRDALDLDPSDTWARLALTDLLRQVGDRAGCEQELRETRSIDPAAVASGDTKQLCGGASPLRAK